jgi:hypothetical protein
MHNLNMWQRLGVVLSLLWIAGGGLWQRSSDVKLASLKWSAEYDFCTGFNPYERKATWTPPSSERKVMCANEAEAARYSAMKGSWGNVAFVAFAPVLLGWLLAYIVLWVAKWVLGGRKISRS